MCVYLYPRMCLWCKIYLCVCLYFCVHLQCAHSDRGPLKPQNWALEGKDGHLSASVCAACSQAAQKALRAIVPRDDVGLHREQKLINLSDQACQQPVVSLSISFSSPCKQHGHEWNAISRSTSVCFALRAYKTPLPAIGKQRGLLHWREETEMVMLGSEFYKQTAPTEWEKDSTGRITRHVVSTSVKITISPSSRSRIFLPKCHFS